MTRSVLPGSGRPCCRIVAWAACIAITAVAMSGGCDSGLASPFRAYIADKPFRFSGGKRRRMSPDYERFRDSSVRRWVRNLPCRHFISPEPASPKVGEERLFTTEPYSQEREHGARGAATSQVDLRRLPPATNPPSPSIANAPGAGIAPAWIDAPESS